MKKSMLMTVITIFTLSLFGGVGLAQTDRTVTNTSKKGSLLIWPLVKVGTGDTMIQLSNEYYQSVRVRCTYRVPFPSSHTSWAFTLKANQTVAWRASTGKGPDGKAMPIIGGTPPALRSGTAAELACWAVDSGQAQQIAWNWLTGDAIVGEGSVQRWEYSAWRFAVNSSTTGATAGTAGTIKLTGDSGNYDACPTGLLFNFLKQSSTALSSPSGTYIPGTVNATLTLVPCSADFVTDAYDVTYSNLNSVDEKGTVYSGVGSSVCVGGSNSATQWYSGSLLSLANSTPFTDIETPSGIFRVHGVQYDTACGAGSKAVPVIGVMSMQLVSASGPVVGGTATAVGPGQGYARDATDTTYISTAPISIKFSTSTISNTLKGISRAH